MKEFVLRGRTPKDFRIDYGAHLNEQQLAVVEAGEGPLLVIAGAGSGKTRTLTYRVARLVESGVQPRQIMLLTFTNKAAREMLSRVERLVADVNLRGLYGGTFHHVGNVIIRRSAPLLGLKKSYTILDRQDSKEMIDDVAAPFHDRHKRFPRGDVLADMFSFAANTGIPPARAVEEKRPEFVPLMEDILHVYRDFRTRKRKANVVDFDDLLLFWRTLLQEHPKELEKHRATFRHLLVDEYQDTNRLQADIVELISGPKGNLMVVGDDAQSIYSFRGANFGNIIDFPQRFPTARTFKLETNYRSTPQILSLANSSIVNNERQFEKVLKPVLNAGPKPDVVTCQDEREQAAFVVERIQQLHNEGVDLRETAVLYRAHFHSLEVQLELQAAGIPYEVRSGMRFFEQAHIKDIAAFLRILVNDKDEMGWKRVLKLAPKVGAKTADKIWRIIEGAPNAIQAAATRKVVDAVSRGARSGVEELGELLTGLADKEHLSKPTDVIRTILEENYNSYLLMKYANAPARADDIRRMADYAMRFESCEALLSEFALVGTVQGDDLVMERDDDDSLVISTIHQAKGLEWKVVFVIWLTEGRFPDPRSCVEQDGLEEERRLFYVATTRAKSELYLTHPLTAAERSFQVFTKPSRFIREIDPDTYEEMRVRPTEW